jgi:hypothetical protein
MTLAELARKNCANFRQGKCIVCGPCKVCSGNRCTWFHQAVLPLAPELADRYWKTDEGERTESDEDQGFG